MQGRFARFCYGTPFFALIIPLLLGIVLSTFLFADRFAYSLGLFFATLFFTLLAKKLRRESTLIAGFALFLFIVATGILAGALVKKKQNSYTLPKFYSGFEAHRHYPVFQAIVTDIQQSKNGSKAVLQVEYLYDSLGVATPVSGKVLAYFKFSDSVFTVGNRVIIAEQLRQIQQFSHSFDYVGYLREMGIFFSVQLRNSQSILQSVPSGKSYFFQKLRREIARLIESCVPAEATANFVKALFIGERATLNTDLKQAYQVSGIMHIMAISGLHIGTLFLFFNYLLAWIFTPWRYRIWARLAKVILLIALLWIYGLVVLGGPSIFRSVLMFSLLALSQLGSQRVNGLNTLFFSACLILIFQPQALYNVGFLLSYSAVLGLLIIVPFVEKYTRKLPKVLAKPASIIIASTAAQLTTLPILLSVFTHFSLYFLIGNLIAIPLIGIIMPLIVIMLILSLIYLPLATLVGWLIHYLLFLLNKGIFILASLPYAYIFTPYFGLWQSLGYYLLLLTFGVWWLFRSRIYLRFMLISIVLFAMTFLWSKYQVQSQHLLYLHSRNWLEYISGRNGIFLHLRGEKLNGADSSLFAESREVHLLKNMQIIPAYDYWYNSRVLLVNRAEDFCLLQPVDLQVLILANFSEQIFTELKTRILCRELILLNYVPDRKLLAELYAYCEQKNILLREANSYKLLRWHL